MEKFFLYILKCNDYPYYVSHTDKIEKYITEHMLENISFCTSTRLPLESVFVQNFNSRTFRYTALRAILKANGEVN